jgi:hypothetical protein
MTEEGLQLAMVILETVNLYRVPLEAIIFSSSDCGTPSFKVSSLIHHDESIFLSSKEIGSKEILKSVLTLALDSGALA